MDPKPLFDPIESVLDDLRAGKPVIVTDDASRENEGDLILAAEKATPESIAFMVKHTSGVICVPMEGGELDRLELPLMTPLSANTERMRTAYTISVDAAEGVTTGISAADRARTIRLSPNRAASRPISRARGTFSRCATGPAAFCAGPGTRRPAWTSRAWRDCVRRAYWRKSSTTTAPWPACRNCSVSRNSTA